MAHWHRCDLLDAGARRRLVAEVRPTGVLHCAWEATPGRYGAAAENLDWAAATLGLLREALTAGARRFVVAGSCAEYDWADPPGRPWREDDPVRPASLYGIAKDGTRRMAAALAAQAGAALCWARLFHLVGPHEKPGRLVPDLLRALRDGAPFATGPGAHRRDWLDVRDAGRALAALLEAGADGPVNVGSGRATEVAALVAAAAAIAGAPGVVGARGGPAGPAAIVADIGRLRRLTGFTPAIPLDQSLRDAWAAMAGPALPADYEAAARLFRQGHLAQAEAATAAILAQRPMDVAALNLMGVTLRRLGRGAEARAALARAAEAAPGDAMPLVNLGNVLLDEEEPEDAAAAFRRADALAPLGPGARRLLARALSRAGRPADALAELDPALAAGPADARELLAERARTRFAAGDRDGALAELDRVAEDDSHTIVLRAQLLRLSGQGRAALDLLARAATECPDDADLQAALADALLSLEDRRGANAAYRRALSLRPDDEAITAKLCWSLLNSRHDSEAGHLEAALSMARGLVGRGRLQPSSAHAVQSVLLRVGDLDGLDAFDALFPVRRALMDWWVRRDIVGALHAELGRVRTLPDRHVLVDCHRAWGERVERPIAPLRPHCAPPRRAAPGRMRVGFMSSDLRHHPVAYFAQPIFEHYDRDRFELFAYSFHPGAPDAVQRRIAGQVSAFRALPGLPDAEIAARIADDGLDALFELGGSTHLNRLHVMAHQPAPVQVSWLGYPHSSGLSRVQRIVVDPCLRPPDPALLIEQPLVMPSSWVTLGPLGFNDEAVIEDGLPEDRAGRITFGTMNNPYKYTREGVALWSSVLRAVPGSRFLFVRPEAGVPAFRAHMARAFARHGIDAERLAFRAVRGRHLAHYNEIDIALDTVPQTGGTTTCECLWMGVPTVTLAGPALFERLSFSTLSNVGLADLAATDAEGYVAAAVRLAGDAPRRRDLRAGLRGAMRGSPLGDNAGWVRSLEGEIGKLCNAPRA